MPARRRTAAPRLTSVARLRRLLFHHAEKQEAEGILFGMLLPEDDDREQVYPRVAAALRLIAAHDPRRMERLRRLAVGIHIAGEVGAHGYWLQENRLVQLNRAYVAAPETTLEQVASTIVHEGAHAWLHSLGFTYDEPVRARIERICVRTQAAFLDRVPGAEPLARATRDRMDQDPAFYTDAAFRARSREQSRAVVREAGAPAWIARPLSWTLRAGFAAADLWPFWRDTETVLEPPPGVGAGASRSESETRRMAA